MTIRHIIGLFLFLSIISCEQEEEANWLKGNLHTHTYWSDGDGFPEMVLDWYKSNDYQFIALSEHNIIARTEKWKKLPKSMIYQQAFEDYLKKYGEDWVEYKEDSTGISVKLKTETEYKPLFEEDGKFAIITAQEITDGYGGKPLHMNATNVQELIQPRHGNSVAETMQNNIDAVLEQREATGEPIMPHINHPNFGWAVTVEDMKSLRGERFFEVFNGHPQVHNYGDSTRMGMEEMWDQINIAYLNRNQPLMYGIATDDSHNYHLFGGQYSNSGRGWVMVNSKSLDAKSIIETMEAGNFYASTGVTLASLEQDENEIELEVKAEAGVSYTIEFIGVRKGSDKSEVFETVNGTKASFELTKEMLFVRARVRSSKIKENPFQEGDYEMAWSQPISDRHKD
ncbi:CehA/McbA family metallohydrolase domain-containing protein [Roseivirga echinicomitans]|uniref:Histidinol-phosphatase n=1 Tax=Roseivirga echinicomitans TaxID=296218 RepID=A0A150X9Y7_9BACT|nr:histidinol-phosphatase [Roseivirga echinicomitans]KYG75549.1 histidinol-phosphatase [Roseivirga echinicomitans]